MSPDPVIAEDAAIIKKYLDKCTEDGINASTARVTASYLCIFSRKSPKFTSWDTGKAVAVFKSVREGMKPNSARRAFTILKQFLKWMRKAKVNTKVDPERISEIKPPKANMITKKASDMLSGEEIKLLIDTAWTDRDKALVAMIYEGALRPIEAVNATWGDLNFDKYGAQFHTDAKTGIPRYIRLIMSAPYLLKWKNSFPVPIKSNTPIFCARDYIHSTLTVNGVRTVFRTILKKAGIQKDISVYYLRHSRITSMTADEIPDSVIKLQAWGSLSTNMLGTYAHLTNTNTDRILLTRAGVLTKEETERKNEDALKPRQCPHCGEINVPTATFCIQCGLGLTPETRVQTQTDAEKVEMLTKQVVGMQNQFAALIADMRHEHDTEEGVKEYEAEVLKMSKKEKKELKDHINEGATIAALLLKQAAGKGNNKTAIK